MAMKKTARRTVKRRKVTPTPVVKEPERILVKAMVLGECDGEPAKMVQALFMMAGAKHTKHSWGRAATTSISAEILEQHADHVREILRFNHIPCGCDELTPSERAYFEQQEVAGTA